MIPSRRSMTGGGAAADRRRGEIGGETGPLRPPFPFTGHASYQSFASSRHSLVFRPPT